MTYKIRYVLIILKYEKNSLFTDEWKANKYICLFLGPAHWPEKYKTCAGKYQSPIDIEESLVTQVSLAPLKTTGFNTAPKSFNISNNGHTGL